MPTRVYLVRHGAVDAAWRGRIYGCHDVALSESGQREARAAAELLREIELDRVVSSGLLRTEYGAAQLRGGRALERLDDPELREIDRGRWVGKRPAETDGGWERWHAAPDRERPAAGESLDDLAARVLPSLDSHVRAVEGGALAVVAHSWVVRVTICHALSLARRAAPRLVVPTGSVHVLDWPRGGAETPTAAPGGLVGESPKRDKPGPQEGTQKVTQRDALERGPRPTLVAFGLDGPAPERRGWYRAPS